MKKIVLLISACIFFSSCAVSPSYEVETDYDVTAEYIENEDKVRYTLNGYDGILELYYERPYYSDGDAGLKAVNAYFDGLSEEFFEGENVKRAVEYAELYSDCEDKAEFVYKSDSCVLYETEQIVSVTISYEWCMGGVMDYGSDSYTFDKSSGKLLTLADITGLDESELKKIILDTVGKVLPEGDVSYVDGYSVNDFEFALEEGKIYINFDKYEASYGAAGAFHIETPLTEG